MRYVPTIAATLLACQAHAQEIVEIPPPEGYSFAIVEGVSDGGRVVVGFATANSHNTAAMRWTVATGSQLLPGLPGFDAPRAVAVSADGSTILGEVTRSGGERRVVLWRSDGSIQPIDFPGHMTRVWASDLSHDGRTAIGFVESESETLAWRWEDTSGLRLFAQADGFAMSIPSELSGDGKRAYGVVANDPGPIVPCTWDERGDYRLLPPPPDIERFQPNDVSQDGSFVVGWAFDALWEPRPYFWSESSGYTEIQDFEDLRTYGSWALSPDGTVWLDNPFDNGYLWREDLGVYQIEDVLHARGLRYPGLRTHYIQAVSPDGTAIIGHGDDRPHAGKGVDRAWLITNFTLPTDCPSDIDLNERLDTFDFLAFLNRFNEGDMRADVDGDGQLTIADFMAFQTAFEGGC